MGFLENAALAASRGVAPADFAATMPAMTALLLDHMADAARRIWRATIRAIRRPSMSTWSGRDGAARALEKSACSR